MNKNKKTKKWDEESPLYSELLDKYFKNKDEVQDYLWHHGPVLDKLKLFICEPYYLSSVEEDYWCDELPEEAEEAAEAGIPDEIRKAMMELNRVISNCSVGWKPTEYRADCDIPCIIDPEYLKKYKLEKNLEAN